MSPPFLLLLCIVLVCATEEEVPKKPLFEVPVVSGNPYLALYFASSDLSDRLVVSSAKKDGADESIAKYDGLWSVEVESSSAIENDYALVLKSQAKHHAIAVNLDRPLKFDTPDVVIQYDVKFANGIDCGGAYIKLLSETTNLRLHQFNDKTPYTIMFGPDKCGLDHKFHFIIRYKNPKTGTVEEKHAKKISGDLEKYFTDKKTHLYTLLLRDDNTFERYIDQVKVQTGNLLTDMEPAVNPPEEIDDPNDVRPSDWDERETIIDPAAKKPDDWDEEAPEFIIDETASKPEGWLDDEPELVPDAATEMPKDWDTEMDGEWEAPLIKNEKCSKAPGCGEWKKPQIKNPSYKGKWSAPLIPNPAYQGVWKPRKIKNPDYFYDEKPFKGLTPVTALGLELWSMSDNIVFDNLLIVDSLEAAKEFGEATWGVKSKAETLADPRARSVVDAIREAYSEKPMVVFAIGFACTIPFLLCLWLICRPRQHSPSVSVSKKTDSFTPDDKQPTKYDANRPVNSSSTDDVQNADDEDEDEEDDLVRVSNDADSDVDVDKRKEPTSKADLESDSNEDVDASEPKPAQTGKQAVRKRRSRKE